MSALDYSYIIYLFDDSKQKKEYFKIHFEDSWLYVSREVTYYFNISYTAHTDLTKTGFKYFVSYKWNKIQR